MLKSLDKSIVNVRKTVYYNYYAVRCIAQSRLQLRNKASLFDYL